MWPWEHAAIGYLAYSLLCRLEGELPSASAVVAVLVGTQFPDLVDKPLAWYAGVVPSGQSVAHSLLVAVPLTAVLIGAAVLWTRRYAGPRTTLAVARGFTVGYLSHLPGDIAYSALLGGGLNTDFLLWPLVPASTPRPVDGTAIVWELVRSFATFLDTPAGKVYLVGELSLLLLALLVWRADGYPGLRKLLARSRA